MQKQLIMDHILQVIFGLAPDSPVERVLNHNGYVSPEDLLMETDDMQDYLKYPNDAKALVKIPKGNAGMLKSFKQYVASQSQKGTPIDSGDWMNITRKEFNNFRISNANNVVPIVATSALAQPPPVHQPFPIDIVKDFKCRIKHNIG